MKNKIIHLLGTRGLPANHGGFETFIANLAPFLADKGWDVRVYCQRVGSGPITEEVYKGFTLINVPVTGNGTKSTIIFDWLSLRYALRSEGILLSFGYPTGIFAILPRMLKRCHIINMDGIEWKRSQFGWIGRIAYYINERFAAYFANHLVADHPEIAKHLSTRVRASKISTIAYGAPLVENADVQKLKLVGVEAEKFAVVIARPEPDNSILEIVRAFSGQKSYLNLVVLGALSSTNKYHSDVIEAANEKVIFPGAIYDSSLLAALRKYCRFYVHGHRVGGTNPSLVEALGAGSAVLAHDNKFNRWVTNNSSIYFDNVEDMRAKIEELAYDDELISKLRLASQSEHFSRFTWEKILSDYHDLLLRFTQKKKW